MRYTDDKPLVPDTSTTKTCGGVRADLRQCLLETDCCRVDRRSPKECLKERHPSVPEECYSLLNTFFECKRGLLDFRQRFRGSKGY